MESGTALPVQTNSKSAEWRSITDFGAVGDNFADNTTAIQSAFTSGHSIVIPVGDFRRRADHGSSWNLRLRHDQGCIATHQHRHRLRIEDRESRQRFWVWRLGLREFQDRLYERANSNVGIEVLARGFAYYSFCRVWVTGSHKYGMVLDQAEVASIELCNFDNTGGRIRTIRATSGSPTARIGAAVVRRVSRTSSRSSDATSARTARPTGSLTTAGTNTPFATTTLRGIANLSASQA